MQTNHATIPNPDAEPTLRDLAYQAASESILHTRLSVAIPVAGNFGAVLLASRWVEKPI